MRAVNSADLSGVLSVWSDDGVMMPPHHAAVHGRAAIEEYFRQLFERARLRFVFTETSIVVEGNMAVERITYTADVWPAGSTTAVSDRGKGMHVYRRQTPGEWKLIADLWNTDLPRP